MVPVKRFFSYFLCRVQLGVFEECWNVFYLANQKEKEIFSKEEYQRSREINAKFKALNTTVREHLAKLDVID